MHVGFKILLRKTTITFKKPEQFSHSMTSPLDKIVGSGNNVQVDGFEWKLIMPDELVQINAYANMDVRNRAFCWHHVLTSDAKALIESGLLKNTKKRAVVHLNKTPTGLYFFEIADDERRTSIMPEGYSPDAIYQQSTKTLSLSEKIRYIDRTRNTVNNNTGSP
jgi:hypothetical protein